jgi:hypothetical protein
MKTHLPIPTTTQTPIIKPIITSIITMPSKWFNAPYIMPDAYKDIYPTWYNLHILDVT